MISRYTKSFICCLLILSTLFFGMCSTSVGGHSLFVPENTASSTAAPLTESTISPLRNHLSSQQIYTPETSGEQQVLITPRQEIRRIIARFAPRSLLFQILPETCAFSEPILTRDYIRLHFDKITIDRVIITYIHRQDGDKHRLLFS